jgi:cytidyltransferase-like protein
MKEFDSIDLYKDKIKTPIELKKILKKNKDFKSILCHGVFDIVHPGHMRHLIYAKKIADILIVSITADLFIKKGKYRPHVPQKLRALNLAAFQMVDYVVIDNNLESLKLIKDIKPTFYAKGFEYGSKNLNKATSEEEKVLKSYGGKIIFTPGDHVFSSSKFLNSHLPNLSDDKLIELMRNNKIDFNMLIETINKFNKVKCHVVGDIIVDTYTRTSMIGGQTKTPTISVLYEKHEDYIGGAGIVSMHLLSAGADVSFTSIIGNDKLGKFVIKELKPKIDFNYYVDETKPTTNKNAIICDSQRLLKVDRLDNRPISQDALDFVVDNIKESESEITLFCDFRHGIFNQQSVNILKKAINKKSLKIADSQVASRWGCITDFENFDLVTPNEREARFALADQDSTVGRLSQILTDKINCKNLILKLGSKGVFCKTSIKNSIDSYFSIDSFTNKPVDPVGAGDALLAYSGLSLYVSKSLVISSIIGSMAAAVECELDGNIPVKKNQVINKIKEIQKRIQNNYKYR